MTVKKKKKVSHPKGHEDTLTIFSQKFYESRQMWVHGPPEAGLCAWCEVRDQLQALALRV